MDDQQFRILLDRFSLSWKGYRKVRKGVKKRIRRHMQQLKCKGLESYLRTLDADQDLRLQCERLLTVSISRFFRDRLLWEALENSVLPDLVEKGTDRVSAWSAGCARGEEVYSLKILWDRLGHRFERLPELVILATDLNPMYLRKARTGIYSRSSLKEVPEALRSEYFTSQGGKGLYKVQPFINGGISWEVRDLLDDPPGRSCHLILVRNSLLTYYRHEISAPALCKIIDVLVPGGFLIIGSHEKLPMDFDGLTPSDKCAFIFTKTSESPRPSLRT